MKDNIDYFEQYEILEKEYPAIYNIVMEQDELESYEDTERLLYKLNSMGWTFNYGLDNSPFNLRPFVFQWGLAIRARYVEICLFWKKLI